MVKLLKTEMAIIWWGGSKEGGVRSKITQENHEQLREKAPGTWGKTEKIDEFRIRNTSTLSKEDLSVLIQDVLNALAKRSLTYKCILDGLPVKLLFEIAELLKIEVPKKVYGRQLTNLILEKLRAH